MEDLATWMLQWTFSLAGLAQLLGAMLLAGAAVCFSPSRSVAKFLSFALVLWLATSLLGALEPSRLRAFLAWAIWVFSIVIVYAIVLGILVAMGKGPRSILAASAVVLVLQTPLSWLSGLYFTCYVGHDCP